ncbi:V-type ATP synthase subunit D [Oxobacter pfennigii]|uniref:V-type ATP synthase subunit D n=1 Tax=Oxobacter pfennigii TaxID=36849 RepID=A0A0P8WES2_9CLOT|nr:V-type ATP synthase subunit D [Oxobacter pfennigii]KPU46253.1 V-type ATP synthase subunit D [Oxobacter pfennigii]
MAVNIAPTKSNLMSANSSLEFSKKGFELLDKKRNVLIREMMGLIGRAKDIQDRINSTFTEAYEALEVANMTEGISTVESIAMSVDETEDYEVLLRSVMGVEIPSIKFDKENPQPSYSFYRTNNALDIAVIKFHEVKYLIYELAEVENSVYRLAMEVKKTQKRTNALQNIQIPKFMEIVKYIQDVLEEKEREDFFRLKMVKKKSARKK